VKGDHLTPEVNFTGLRVFKRVCQTCCDMLDCTQRLKTD
jgi:hypothetical protein